MEKIVSGIQGIRFKYVNKILSSTSKAIPAAYFSLILEGFIAINDMLISMDEDKSFSYSHSWADAKFLDGPGQHYGKRNPKHLLYEYIGSGIKEFFERNHSIVQEFLEKEEGSLDNSELFRPSLWRNGSLRIPIEFIQIFGIVGDCGTVKANMLIGHHILMIGVPIYPRFVPEGRIFDKRIIVEIEKMLDKKDVKDSLGYYARASSHDLNDQDKMTVSISGCNQEKFPLVRFY
jgi:hypothetical protein